MMPVPSHLRDVAIPKDSIVDEEGLVADLRCPCGSDRFVILHIGETQKFHGETYLCTVNANGHFFFLLAVRCVACGREHLLLDAHLHGWDGFVCHDPAKAAIPRPSLVSWHCEACGGGEHTGVVSLETQGRQDFIDNVGDEFDHDRWPDAFGWFTLEAACCGCGSSHELVSYETM